ncbi:MAG: ABC transporter permease, partial [Geminicoccaceae bacterium]
MLRYFAHRAAEAGLLLVLMSFVIYLLLGLMPGDPIDIMASGDPEMSTDDIARLKALYGLDRPITERYYHWLAGAASGDFGFSRLHTRPVLEVLGPRLWNTTVLMGLSFA